MIPDIHLLLLIAFLGALALGYLLAQVLPLQHLGALVRSVVGLRTTEEAELAGQLLRSELQRAELEAELARLRAELRRPPT